MKKPVLSFALVAVSALVLAGCASTDPGSGDTGGGDTGGDTAAALKVTAVTNVYGALAEEIGGDHVEVTSIIDSVTQDPHSYEASARDRLAVEEAEFVIRNGGGYDSFMDDLLEGADAHVLTAVEFSHDYPGEGGHEHEHGEEDHDHADEGEEHDHAEGEDHDHADEGEEGHDHTDEAEGEEHDHAEGEEGHEGHNHIEGFNEHVWFDPHTMIHVVEGISEELSELVPEGKDDFAANSKKIVEELEGFEADLEELGTTAAGAKVFITEPLPAYLSEAAGLVDVAPEGFSEAVEEGNDVAPAVLLEAVTVVESGEVKALLTNAQTGGSETERVEQAAKDSGVTIVAFTELLDEGQSYAEWMRDGITNLAAAFQS